jgi:hypothetical protein
MLTGELDYVADAPDGRAVVFTIGILGCAEIAWVQRCG